jgi:S-DNA-T family DNA segregation ATPase FtsK/SpoIIIE
MSTQPTPLLTQEQNAVITALTFKMTQLGLRVKPLPKEVSVGPVVTVYRFEPQGSTKVAHIEALSQDFAVILAAEDVVVKRLPGETSVAVFVPNKERQSVQWFNVCQIPQTENRPNIPLLMGIDHLGRRVIEDLSLFPHLLVAGSTGGGKSTWMGSEIATIILNYSPQELRIALSDTKGVEFHHFANAPHLLSPTATSVDDTIKLFDQLITMMDDRLKLFGQKGHRNIIEYNEKTSQNRLPYVCLFIDELFDILSDKRRLEVDEGRGPRIGEVAQGKLCKLAAKARASGIHIIAATQRPSVKIIEGDIKANFPARLSFRLPSEADSRTVLGTSGAEHLLSRGDMLFINPNKPGIYRIHAPIASLSDIKACVEYALRK